jgi:hypothetical protein
VTKKCTYKRPSLEFMGVTYKSTLEVKVAEDLHKRGYEYKYEPCKLNYIIPASKHTYTPDFKIGDLYIECKGAGPYYGLTVETRNKMLQVREDNPGLDIRLVLDDPYYPFSPGSNTTYAMWCQKNHFEWAEKLIPNEWLEGK